jgi:hypothetical protein
MLMRTSPPTQEWRDNLAAAITDEDRYGSDPVERGINAAIQFFVTRTKSWISNFNPSPSCHSSWRQHSTRSAAEI